MQPATRREEVLVILAWTIAEGHYAYAEGDRAWRHALTIPHTVDVCHGDEGDGWWSRHEHVTLDDREQARMARAIGEVLLPALLSGDSYALESIDILPLLRTES